MDKNKNILIFIIVLIIYRCIYRYHRYIFDDSHQNKGKYILPKIIWTHWDNMDKASLFIKNNIEMRKKKLNDWTIHFLNDSNIDLYIDRKLYPKNYNKLMPAHKSDWVRMYLLQKYGGVWLDAGIIINNEIDFNNIYENSIIYESELTGFYLEGSTINNDPTTFIENWFIMVPLNSRIMKSWYREFEYAINIGFLNYRNEITNKGVDVIKVYMFGEGDTYLTNHAALQKILQLKEIFEPRILLYKAEDTMFKLQIECKWDEDCIYKKITTENLTHIPYIKLRGSDRKDGNFLIIT